MLGEEGEGVMKGWGERVSDEKKLIQWMTSDPQASVRGETVLQGQEGNQISDWLGFGEVKGQIRILDLTSCRNKDCCVTAEPPALPSPHQFCPHQSELGTDCKG